ncbi:nuclear transport factor 2 family protein [Alteromonas sp. C1M14]|uniref:nuclear transport factor 2 family protein n=1 Tax=Alteromonas sp. C1M14 TaxID=2841567 RepID=UPI001C095B75|nr:nuclear transport factor 2 family protein [Alteromonas sp. C1M14]MBU2978414.1 nuclear transport factor 2 family protein [Alteromonas sp. C1M14]
MRLAILTGLCWCIFHLTPANASPETVLDQLHQAAADANYEQYFDTFASNGVFIGTDASEVWTVEAFKNYAKPIFAAGKGWVYHPKKRHVYYSSTGDIAWFDELLDSESYGQSRGTGVLEKQNGKWKIVQYHLTFPIPNPIAKKLTDEIKAFQQQPSQ